MIEPALTLFTNQGLYSPTLYDGAPISPGPGWILQNAPFAILDLYWLLSAFYITLTVALFHFLFKKYRETNLVLILLSSSLLFWELLVTGHDLIAIGFSFVFYIALTYRLSNSSSDHHLFLCMLAITVGIFATSRILFFCFPILLSAFLWKFNRRQAIQFSVISLSVTALFHGYFYTTSDHYQPLHLFSRGSTQVGSYLSMFGLIATISAFFIVYRSLQNSIESWLFSVFVCISLPLTVIAIGEFMASNYDFSLWEGANYLMPSTPILVFLMACQMCKHSDLKSAGSH
ncbi:MAG: hypothetical protein KUG82_19460 [Pseudomonadales bacterium]|nr:hypothetical protein [Pseudomonadales bacterium]